MGKTKKTKVKGKKEKEIQSKSTTASSVTGSASTSVSSAVSAVSALLKKVCGLTAAAPAESGSKSIEDIIWILQSISNHHLADLESVNCILDNNQFISYLLATAFASASASNNNDDDADNTANQLQLSLECLGLLANLIDVASPDHLAKLYESYNLSSTTSNHLLSKLRDARSFSSSASDEDSISLLATIEQSAQILSAFAENLNVAMVALTPLFVELSTFVSEFVNYLSSTNTPDNKSLFKAQIAALRAIYQLLNTLGEENDDLSVDKSDIDMIGVGRDTCMSMALKLDGEMKSCVGELGVLGSSVLFNISSGDLDTGKVFDSVEATLILYNLDEMTTKVLQDAATLQRKNEVERDEKQQQLHDLVSDQNRQTDYIQACNKHLGVLQFGLELLTNVFTSPDSAANTKEEVEGDEMDETTLDNADDEMDMDFDNVWDFDSILTSSLSSALFSLISLKLPHIQTSPPASRAYLYSLEKVYLRATSCLSNVYLVGADKGVINEADGEKLWRMVYTNLVTFSNMSPIPMDLVESSVTLLFSILQRIAVTPDEEMVKWVMTASSSTSPAPLHLKGHLISILGRLALQTNTTLNKTIGDWLVTYIQSSLPTTPTLLAPLLNAVFEVYADASFTYNGNYTYNPVLKSLVPGIKGAWKGMDARYRDGRRDRDDLMEAWENLKAFITYKAQE